MNKQKFGFTLSEMLIALVIIGVLGMVLAPVLTKMMPDQNKVLIKRSYYVITNTVSAMLENEDLYSPFGTGSNATSLIYKGFDDTNSVVYNGKTYSGQSKFANLFIYTINGKTVSDSISLDIPFKEGAVSSTYSGSYNTAQTKDGILWRFNGDSISGDKVAYILVDVNGTKGPNCFEGASSCSSRKKDFDRYTVAVYNDGKVVINANDVWVRSILNASSSVNVE